MDQQTNTNNRTQRSKGQAATFGRAGQEEEEEEGGAMGEAKVQVQGLVCCVKAVLAAERRAARLASNIGQV